MDTFLVVLGIVAAFIAGLVLRHYLPAYASEKGKNLATKEDIGEITREIESVKNEYAHQLESLRALLQSRSRIFEVRYVREFDVLQELTTLLVDVRDTATALRPVADYVTVGESEDDRRRNRLGAYSQAAHALYRFAETRRPFFPPEIYAAVQEILRTARREAVEYANRKPEGEEFTRYWEEARKNADQIMMLTEQAIDTIRERVRVWELADPIPDGK